MKLSRLILAAALAASSSAAIAETQGTPGQTSTGTVTINASTTPEVSISNLDDFTFTAAELVTALNTGRSAGKTDDICLWSNNVDRSLYITATGDGAGGSFTLTDGTRTLRYFVRMSSTGGSGSTQNLTAGMKSRVFTVGGTGPGGVNSPPTPDCAGGSFVNANGALSIVILASDISSMEATTTYTGVLTLLATPS